MGLFFFNDPFTELSMQVEMVVEFSLVTVAFTKQHNIQQHSEDLKRNNLLPPSDGAGGTLNVTQVLCKNMGCIQK